MKVKQKDFDKYLTSQLQAGSTLLDYEDNVFKWLEDIISKKDLRDNERDFKSIIEVCFKIPIKSLDCAKYILDKFFNDPNANKKIKFNIDVDKLITEKSILLEIASNQEFRISAKLSDDYFLLMALKRMRTHRDANNKKLNNKHIRNRIHLSALNKDYKIIIY